MEGMRFFNTEGPVRPDDHYCIPPLERIDLGAVILAGADEQAWSEEDLLYLRDLGLTPRTPVGRRASPTRSTPRSCRAT